MLKYRRLYAIFIHKNGSSSMEINIKLLRIYIAYRIPKWHANQSCGYSHEKDRNIWATKALLSESFCHSQSGNARLSRQSVVYAPPRFQKGASNITPLSSNTILITYSGSPINARPGNLLFLLMYLFR